MDLEPRADQAGVPAGDEAVNDHEFTSAMSSQPQVIEDEYLEWKSSGRPPCPKCRKHHFGHCKTPQWELRLINRDPEGYERRRRRMEKQKKRRQQSTGQQISAPQDTLPNSRQPEKQSTHAFLGAPQDTTLDGGRQRGHQSTHSSPNDVNSNFLRFMVDLCHGHLPRSLVELPGFAAASQQFGNTKMEDRTSAALQPPTNNNTNFMYAPSSTDWPSGDWPSGDCPSGDWPSGDWPSGDWPSDDWLSGDIQVGHGPEGSTDIRALAGQTSGDVSERGEDLLRQQTTEVVRSFQI